MAFATMLDAPATEEMYRSVRSKLGDEAPQGLVLHMAIKTEGGIRHFDVWETEADWERFASERLGPAVVRTLGEFGIPQPDELLQRQPLDLVDVWLP